MIHPPKETWLDFFTKDPDRAWDSFLERFNKLIMAVIRKLVSDHDETMEIYAHVLENLKKDNYKKLTSFFDQRRDYGFESWIAVVARNCCFDWFRREKGRRRLLKCIKALPSVDQWIFRYIYWQGLSRDVTHQLLTTKHIYKLSYEEMCAHLENINRILHQQTKWNIRHNWQDVLPPISVDSDEQGGEQVISHHDSEKATPSPEKQLIARDSAQKLQEILSTLPIQEQLIIQLRFYKDLTLEEIARVLKMKNLWQVRRKLQKALKSLQKKLRERGIGPSDIEIF